MRLVLILVSALAVSLMLLSLGNLVWSLKYELGLKSPKYQVGECLKKELSTSEFDHEVSYYKVVKLGQKDYLLERAETEGRYKGGYPISIMDESQRVDCNDLKKILE